jgi:hypothetical protein
MKYTSVILLTFLALQTFGQAGITASVSKNKVHAGERFTFSITVSNCDGKNLKTPDLTDFQVVGGPNQSQQFSMINGKTSQSIAYNYVLQPKSTGQFTINSASIQCDNKTYSTQAITIQVTDAPQGTTGSQSTNASNDILQHVRDNLFIKAEVSKNTMYKGEQFLVTYKLYYSKKSAIADFGQTSNPQIPKFDGFYTEDISPQNQMPQMETLNGILYQTQVIKQYRLTAQNTGENSIEPLKIPFRVAVQTQKQNKNRSIFDDFFGSRSYEELNYTAASPALKIKVLELPSPVPADFNGAVGNFSMKTELSQTKTTTDEPLTYKIIVSGSGNLALFTAPDISLPPGWETSLLNTIEGNTSRVYEYLLIPRSPGEFTIPSHTWSFFSPAEKQYISLASDTYTVLVEAGQGFTGSNTAGGVSKEQVEMLEKDIRYINKQKPVFINTSQKLQKPLFYSAISMPFLLGVILFIYADKKKKAAGDIVSTKNKKATATARKRLKQAHVFAQQNDSKHFHDETIKALWGYVSDKFAIPQSDLTKENITGILRQYQVSESTGQRFMELLNTCELAVFAPQVSASNLKETYAEAAHVITKLESEIQR